MLILPTYYSTCFVIIHSTGDDRSSVETCLANLKNWSFSLKSLLGFISNVL